MHIIFSFPYWQIDLTIDFGERLNDFQGALRDGRDHVNAREENQKKENQTTEDDHSLG